MEVAPFFVEFHNLRTFVAIYILSRFTHFFRNFFLAKVAISATSHVFCMYVPRILITLALLPQVPGIASHGHLTPNLLQVAGRWTW